MTLQMRAVAIAHPGGPEVLVPVTTARPVPGAGEILVRVAAAGVNRPDLLQRQGRYPPPPGASPLPGLEVAGVVDAVAHGVDRWRVGERVCALVAGGGYAEYCVVPQEQCLPVPAGLSMTEAAALPETCFTVWTNVFERGGLQPGESLLVHGGASGIGTIAIQMARALGSTVFATAGTDAKCEACRTLGATVTINYAQEPFAPAILAATNGRGVDVILDMVGGDYTPRNLECLADDGRLVQIAFLRGARVEIDLSAVMRRRLTITGSTLRPRSPQEKGRIARGLEERVWPQVATGRIRPVLHRVLPLAEASDAHRVLEAGAHVGKIVLVTGAVPEPEPDDRIFPRHA